MPPEPLIKCFVHPEAIDFWKPTIHREVCKDLPVTFKVKNHHYCVLHYPDAGKGRTTNFDEVLRARLEAQINDFHFVYFPGRLKLADQKFSTKVFFISATFAQEVDFRLATFEELTSFNEAVFMKRADFTSSVFTQDVDFSDAVFYENADFISATFAGGANFRAITIEEDSYLLFKNTEFKGSAQFQKALFKGHIGFEGKPGKLVFTGKDNWLRMEHALIENPRRVSFHTVRLRPGWFINTAARDFIFTNCIWTDYRERGLQVRSELAGLKEHDIENPHTLLSKACQQLADNYEENKSFERASMFRLMAGESMRLNEYNGLKLWSLHWWYWLSSYYGESWIRAVIVLSLLLLMFSLAYMLVDFQVCPMLKMTAETVCEVRGLNFAEALRHSLTTATFQSVEFRRPVTGWGEAFTILEKIFVPLQAALLALAVRRKFMR